MTDQDYIKAAVELADGAWFMQDNRTVQTPFMQVLLLDDLMQWDLDALAAQLVRQVDALRNPSVGVITSELGSIHICENPNCLQNRRNLAAP